MRRRHPLSLLLGLGLILGACGESEPKNDEEELVFVPLEEAGLEAFKLYQPPEGSSARLALDAGLTAYFEKITRVVHYIDAEREGEEGFTFDLEEGPACMRGDPYSVSIRDQGSKDLILFLQGGGACWSEFCLAVTKAPISMPRPNILDPDLEENPFTSLNAVYFPYCDGSLFAGDNIVPEDDPSKIEKGHTERLYRGLANLTAGLVVSKARFPNPERIVLAGSSAGGYGTIMAAFVVRYVYPEAELIIINDSGIGVGKPGEVDFVQTLLDEFDAGRFVPEDCEECFVNGHITPLIDYFLERDTNSRAAALTSWYDYIISDVFMRIDRDRFADALDEETSKLNEKFPDRYRRFIYWGAKGSGHTALLGDASGLMGTGAIAVELPRDLPLGNLLGSLELLKLHELAIGDVKLTSWLDAMYRNDLDEWADIAAPREPEPAEEGEKDDEEREEEPIGG